jgi:Mrp family chromosome partitioning ATPase
MRIRSVEEDTRSNDIVYAKGEGLAHQLPIDRLPGSLAGGVGDSDSQMSQLIRSLRLSISALVRPSSAPARSIAVVGIDAAAEAAVIAANLGISYAQTGVTTVIVDGNLTDAMQHDLLSMPLGDGLATVLSGASEARAATMVTSVRNLSLLTAGETDTPEVALIDGERFHRRAMPLLDWHDMLIVDGGNATNDPPSLCEVMDGVVLIVRRNKTEIAKVDHIRQRLIAMKTTLFGIIIAQ